MPSPPDGGDGSEPAAPDGVDNVEVAPTEEIAAAGVVPADEVAPTEEIVAAGVVPADEVAPTEEIAAAGLVPADEVAPTEEIVAAGVVPADEVAPTEQIVLTAAAGVAAGSEARRSTHRSPTLAIVAIGALAAILIGVGLFLRRDTPDSAVESTSASERAPGAVAASTTVAAIPTATTAMAPATTVSAAVTAPTTSSPSTTGVATTVVQSTLSSTTSSTTTAPSTTVSVTATTVFGDLRVPSHRMEKPECDGSFITIVGSAINPDQYVEIVQMILDTYPDSQYLRTDQTCSSLRADFEGNPIYVGYFGPFVDEDEACARRSFGPSDAYVRVLSSSVSSSHVIDC